MKYLLFLILFLLSGASPAFSANLIGDAKLTTDLDANGHLVTNTDPQRSNLLGQAFVFEGDSITAGTNTSDNAHRFGDLFMQGKFAKNHGTYHNVAVSGAEIPTGAASGNNLTDHYAANVYPHRPATNGGDGGPVASLFVLIGTNDIGNSAKTGTQVIGYLSTYLAQAKADGFTIVLCTILNRCDGAWTAQKEAYRQQVNAAIRTGQLPADYICDSAKVLATFSTTYFPDGLHPNDAGHALLARNLCNAMLAGGTLYRPFEGTFENPATFLAGILGDTALTGKLDVDGAIYAGSHSIGAYNVYARDNSSSDGGGFFLETSSFDPAGGFVSDPANNRVSLISQGSRALELSSATGVGKLDGRWILNGATDTGAAFEVSGDVHATGKLVAPHHAGAGSAPTATSLGTNVTSVTFSANSTDTAGTFTVVTSGAAFGIYVFTLNFATAYGNPPVILLQNVNAQVDAILQQDTSNTTTTTAKIASWGGFGAATTSVFNYIVVQPK